ncbi:hypothetical protein ACFL2J_02615 [Candidatus Omnitrophota bacterium]
MRKLVVVLLCLALSGCVATPKVKKAEQEAPLQEALVKKDESIQRLQGLLKERDRQIAEKNEKIEKMRERLEMFGVFEK